MFSQGDPGVRHLITEDGADRGPRTNTGGDLLKTFNFLKTITITKYAKCSCNYYQDSRPWYESGRSKGKQDDDQTYTASMYDQAITYVSHETFTKECVHM